MSSSIIIMNKYIMSQDEHIRNESVNIVMKMINRSDRRGGGLNKTHGLGFPFPITLTFMGITFSAIASFCVLIVRNVWDENPNLLINLVRVLIPV